jgi:predicted DNA-binding WGR domain protein/outer membrane protein assembly factor BamB
MAEERTYLELSEDSGSHKFYEVIVDGLELKIRYGRIGDQGQLQSKKFPSTEKALAEAVKKINEKLKKGYERAVMGERKKRSVTSRSSIMVSATIPAQGIEQTTGQAPVIWKFDSGTSALGIFIDNSRCWVGNETGKIFALDHNGQICAKFKLPDGVKCIVADEDWLYAGCDDGNVYDLTGKSQRVAYEIADDVDIYWLDIKDGILAVSDAKGNVTTINHEDESQWTRKSGGDKGWMVRCDEIGVYHGHSRGVTMYDWEDGKEIWTQPTIGWIGFGWQEESTLYACTDKGKIHCFSKSGEAETVYDCDSFLCSCATAENGKYVFAGDNYSTIYCFNEKGDRLWKLATGCGAAQSMQYFNEHLYIVTNFGFLACIDVSEAAIKAAQAGSLPSLIAIDAPNVEEVSATLIETTSDTGKGVMVECYREGSDLRVRVISEGYNRDWHCQFPKGIREEGARYVVEEIREARGGYYRAFGDIKRLSN